MLSWLKRFFGGGTDTGGSSTVTPVDTGSDSEWERADKYPYDHYTDAIEDIKQFKREGRHDEVIDLLEWCIDYTEAEAEADGPVESEPAPAYYRHLGIVLRKEDRYYDEVDILERYVSWFEDHGGTPREEFVERLERANELASKQ